MYMKSIHWLCAGTAALTLHLAFAVMVKDNIVGQGMPAAGPQASLQGGLAGTLGSEAEAFETEILEPIEEISPRDVPPAEATEVTEATEVEETVSEVQIAMTAPLAPTSDLSELMEVRTAEPDKTPEVKTAPVPEARPRREPKETDAREVAEQQRKEKRKAKVTDGKSKRSARASVRGNSVREGQAGLNGGAGGKSGASGSAINAYASRVRAKILSRRPGSAGYGTTVVSFGLTTSGGLQYARIARSSGNSGLDQKALASVRGASPFPAPPNGAKASQLRFSIPFQFR